VAAFSRVERAQLFDSGIGLQQRDVSQTKGKNKQQLQHVTNGLTFCSASVSACSLC
jgi:hypothetical protein